MHVLPDYFRRLGEYDSPAFETVEAEAMRYLCSSGDSIVENETYEEGTWSW